MKSEFDLKNQQFSHQATLRRKLQDWDANLKKILFLIELNNISFII